MTFEKMIVQISVKDHEMVLYGNLVQKVIYNLQYCDKTSSHYHHELERTVIYFEITYGWIGNHMMKLLRELHEVGIGFKTDIKRVYKGTTFQEFQESLSNDT